MKKSRSDRDSIPHRATQRPVRQRVRIIAGAWRGSQIRFPAGAAIRPTPDRVRETLFNWLSSCIEHARCLDLFSGSGALGLEALSRGAAKVVFVERDGAAVRHLCDTLARFGCESGEVVHQDAWRFLERASEPFDIVFVDPPFHSGWVPRAARALARQGWLSPDFRVYFELERAAGVPPLPEPFVLLKAGRAGEVGYYLAGRRDGARD
jgi:16S rRNA (guanine966-N2)-methyltransferase